MPREQMEFDVLIVGAGPAGLAAAIRLAQLGQQQQKPLNIAVLEKAAEVGDQLLAGAVLEPRALDELLPNWRQLGAPVQTAVSEDQFLFLTQHRAWRLPTPLPMKNEGNYVISLSLFGRFLASHAESLGVNIFPGFAASSLIFEDNKVRGVITGPKGLDKDGKPSSRYQEGFECRAKQTFLAEGCRGSLSQQVMKHYELRYQVDPQTYALGLKELWEIPADKHQAGKVMHSIGWPLDQQTYGGSFVYHLDQQRLALGLVVGLDYRNPYLNPYEEFQRFKMHPAIHPLLAKGKRLAYGARALNEGGIQSLPRLSFPGGLLIGCAAGFLNVPKIKGIHTAMKSGMLAAETVFPLLEGSEGKELASFNDKVKKSWLYEELYRVRNIRPGMRAGLLPGLAYAALDTYLLRGHSPWTFHHHKPDNACLTLATHAKKLAYPKHDGKVSFDLMSSVFLANIKHEENQPCHLHLDIPTAAISVNYDLYASPETRYCPAGVYEILEHEGQPRLQINGANCLHCKACDIKDPTQNILWTAPEGGSGPQYEMM